MLLCTDAIIANVFAGDAIFTHRCQIPFLQHISSDSDYLLARPSLPVPSVPPDSINIQPK